MVDSLSQGSWIESQIVLAALIGLCLLSEAFFSGAEVAFVSADRGGIRRRANAGSRAARLVHRMAKHPERLLATTLLGANLSVISGSFLANELFALRFGPDAAAWSIALMIPLILLCGEILPKTISRRKPEAVALGVVHPLRVAMIVLSPIVAIFSSAVRLILRPLRVRERKHPFVTREELRMILQADQRIALERDEATLIRRLLDFADASAREHMTPLPDVASLSRDATVGDATRLILERGFSRIPIYAGRTDEIVGVVHAMDLIDAPADGPERDAPVAPWMKKPFYVPETARIDRLVDEFRRNHQEMAVVVDEYGAALGVLTLEDVLEEIIGDVLDEFDRPGRVGLERAGPRSVIADGRTRLDLIDSALDVAVPRSGFETVSGLTSHIFQRVPVAGEVAEHDGLRLTVIEATPRAVRRVKIEAL